MSIWQLVSYDFFFFQAEDGIRDIGVTGVQTCALPIYARRHTREEHHGRRVRDDTRGLLPPDRARLQARGQADRKSTRLNSSHANISYAVFCLKKKKKKQQMKKNLNKERNDSTRRTATE